MILQFAKMHGLGNDFMVIDAVTQAITVSELLVTQWADRHVGIGFDQLLVVEAPKYKNVDFHYRIFNADGSEVEQCGNGARCFARFVRESGLTWKNSLRVSTMKGTMSIRMDNGGGVSVNMGTPVWTPDQIPVAETEERPFFDVAFDGDVYQLSCVSMGNPHAVMKVDDVDNYDVERIGAGLSVHEFFPNHANIGFMQVISREEIKLRVYERGCGETLACGSGACAAVAVGQKHGWLDEKVKVSLPGGMLTITSQPNRKIYMLGPAEMVYLGQLEL